MAKTIPAKTIPQLRADAEAIFRAGLRAADAHTAVLEHLRLSPDGESLLLAEGDAIDLRHFRRGWVVGAGKAGAAMAAAVEQLLGGRLPLQGSVNVKYGHTEPAPRAIRLVECGHPVPDAAGVAGTRAIEAILPQLTADDLLFVVISGGASALLADPVAEIELPDLERLTTLLLRAGAGIQELNTVRKHLSTLKGGQLAHKVGQATVLALILSDVVGDRLEIIGSGPTVADPSTFADALAVLDCYGLSARAPAAVLRYLNEGKEGRRPETPKAPMPATVHNQIVGSNRLGLESARQAAEALGYATRVLSSTVEGEAREVAREHAALLREAGAQRASGSSPVCLLSGGETTVAVRGTGKGGRCQEFALAASLELERAPCAVLLAAGTDGSDGPTDAAGAVVDGGTAARARAAGLDPEAHLENNDAYHLLDATGDLLRTGPTGTNVMDLMVMLVNGEGG